MPKATPITSRGIKPIPMAQFRDEVLRDYESKLKGRRSPTFASARRALDLLEFLHAGTTADLTPDLLDRLLGKLEGESDRKIREYLIMFKAICTKAVRRRYLETSPFKERPDVNRRAQLQVSRPADLQRRPGPDRHQFSTLTTFLAECSKTDVEAHRLLALVATVAYTGLDRDEAVRIKVADLDFEARTIHLARRNRKRGQPRGVIPMPDDLARILRGWLRERARPKHRNRVCKLDEAKVAMIRRLHREGMPVSRLAMRFKVTEMSIRHIVSGRGWKHVPTEGEASDFIVDSKWLFPLFGVGSTEHWMGITRLKSPYHLKAVGRAAGILDLTFCDLRNYYKDYIAAGSSPRVIEPSAEAVRFPAPPCPFVLYGPAMPILLHRKRKERLSGAQYDVLKALVDSYPSSLTKFELEELSGHHTTAVKILRGLKGLDEDYEAAIVLPGRRNAGAYRLAAPDAKNN